MNLQKQSPALPSGGEQAGCSVANSAKNATAPELEWAIHAVLDRLHEPTPGSEANDDSHGNDRSLIPSVQLAQMVWESDTQLGFGGSEVRSCLDLFGQTLLDRFAHYKLQRERLIEVYSFLYSSYGHTFVLTESDEELWLDLGLCGHLETYMKWKTGEVLAAIWSQAELPVPPKVLVFFPNRFPKFGVTFGDDAYFRRVRNSPRHTRRMCKFVYSLYQGKAGALPLPEELIAAKVQEAMEALSVEPTEPEEIGVLGRVITKEDIRSELRRTVEEVYGVRHSDRQRKTPHALRAGSTKSSIQSTRSQGGAHEHLTELMDPSCYLSFPQLVGWVKYHERVAPVYSTFTSEMWEEVAEKSRRLSWKEDMVAQPVGLPEPFKVRVITRGPAHHYHLARRWQPEMWRPLKDHPTFELVGAPMSLSIMNRFLGNCDVNDGRMFTSGDYASATDHLDSDLSEACLDAICDCLGVPFEDRIILRDSLTRHTLQYKTQDGFGRSAQQKKGQLMGSPVSFPILCLFNAALTRFALELASPVPVKYWLDELPMLVNGDDLLCRTSDLEYLVWKDIVKFGGLTPSIGKNFRHAKIATINSEMWYIQVLHQNVDRYDESILGFYWGEREPIIELGLARGSMKNGVVGLAGEDISPFYNPQIWGTSKERCWDKFIKSCPDKVVAYDFLWNAVGRKVVTELPEGMPLCVPTWLGGAGFPLPPAEHPLRSQREPSKMQRLAARYINDTWGHCRITSKYLRAIETKSMPASVDAEIELDCDIRKALRIPKPTIIEVPEPKTELTPLPNWMFLPIGSLCNESGSVDNQSQARKLYNGIRQRVPKHQRGPLPLSEFRGRPPPLHRESYVFEGVVGKESCIMHNLPEDDLPTNE